MLEVGKRSHEGNKEDLVSNVCPSIRVGPKHHCPVTHVAVLSRSFRIVSGFSETD